MILKRIKVEKDENYTVISNDFVRDKDLSLKAKGLLLVIMSLPDSWDFSIEGLASILKESKNTIYTIFGELKKKGYCEIKEHRNKNQFSEYEYVLYESTNKRKVIENTDTHHSATIPKNTDAYFTDTKNTDTKNSTQINTYYNKVNNKINKEREALSDDCSPKIEDIQQYAKEINSLVDCDKFFNHFEAIGWKMNGQKIVNWKRLFDSWNKSERRQDNIRKRRVDDDYEQFKAQYGL